MNINDINRINYVRAVNPDQENDRFRKGKKFHSRIKNISRDGKVELEMLFCSKLLNERMILLS